MTLPSDMNTAATVGGYADNQGDVASACRQSEHSERNVEVPEGGEQDIRHTGAGDVHPLILEAATEIGDVNFGSRQQRETTRTAGVDDGESLRGCGVEEVVVGESPYGRVNIGARFPGTEWGVGRNVGNNDVLCPKLAVVERRETIRRSGDKAV